MKTIAITNQKGGCGKTTTAVNLSAGLSKLGYRVLVVDLDPQAHSTLGYGIDPENQQTTVYELLSRDEINAADAVLNTEYAGLDIIGSNILLSGIEFELAIRESREFVLKNKLSSLSENYDYCVIDCSPSLSLLTLNALVASDEVVIPVQAHYYALEGLKQLLETVSIIKERFNETLEIAGIVLTFVESRALLSQQIERQMREYFGDLVYKAVIHRSIKIAESPSSGKPVLTYDPKGKGSVEYLALAEEVSRSKVMTDYNNISVEENNYVQS
jgi:chromosome partitioning protein